MSLLFAGVVLAAVISPGPDFALVVRNALLGGRPSGMWTALGVTLGVFVWVIAAAAGVAALLAASETAFSAVRLGGAAYLTYLGGRAVLAAWRVEGGAEALAGAVEVDRPWPAFRSGLLCNLLNPKAAVFFVALMPQFLGPQPQWLSVVWLAALAAAVTAAWFLLLANLAGTLRRWLARPRVRAAVNLLTGGVLIGLGVRVALGA